MAHQDTVRHISSTKPVFQTSCADIVGILRIFEDYIYCLTVVVRFTIFPEAYPTKHITTETVVQFFFHGWISSFEVPLRITNDRGWQSVIVDHLLQQVEAAMRCHLTANCANTLPIVL